MKTLTFESGNGGEVIHTREREEEEQFGRRRRNKERVEEKKNCPTLFCERNYSFNEDG